MKIVECKYCGDDIVWIEVRGKMIPCDSVDVNPHKLKYEDGPLVTEDGEWISVIRAQAEGDKMYYMNHFKTCG